MLVQIICNTKQIIERAALNFTDYSMIYLAKVIDQNYHINDGLA